MMIYGITNVSLPAYHRLDLGINFRKTTKRGFERILEYQYLYNAYCRMNPLYATVQLEIRTVDFTARKSSWIVSYYTYFQLYT